MSTPLVSILLPTYNRACFLPEAIESVLMQTYQYFELIIIDDGSTDNTHEILSRYDDPRLVKIRHENKGRSYSRNKGLLLAKGEFIAFLDSDDVYLPNKLEVQVQHFNAHPETNMVYTSAYCINENGQQFSFKYKASHSGHIYYKIAFFKPVTITLPTVMLRKNILDKVGEFDEQMHRFEDTDLWRRISKISPITAMSAYTCKLRTHPENELRAQDPHAILFALDYYAKKILREDEDMGLIRIRNGLHTLFLYYAESLNINPSWRQYAQLLINQALSFKTTQQKNPAFLFNSDATITFSPTVSIIIPVYNGANYLNEAINSALNQTYPHIEVLVINDGSNDNGATRQVALSFGEKIRYFEKENGGVASALNFGIDQMQGEYFSWLSHDDLYLPDKIEKQICALANFDPDHTILYGNYSVFTTDPQNDIVCKMKGVPPDAFRYWITIENCLHGCTLLIPKTVFDVCGNFDEALRTTQDYDKWFKLAKFYQFVHIDAHLVKARSHLEQGTIKMSNVVLPECNALLANFVNQLSHEDLKSGEPHSIGLTYAKIASSMWYRGFLPVAKLAALYSLKNCFRMPIKDVIYAQILLIKGFSLFCIIKPLRKILSPYRRLSIRKVINKAKQIGPEALKGFDLKKRFSMIYQYNLFNGRTSRSGEGSDLIQTAIIRDAIPKLLQEYQIETFLDAPCGDWYWMQHIKFETARYIGIDIVDDLIQRNKKIYGKINTTFQCLNIVNDPIPKSDLIFSRDCFVHLSFNDIINALRNFKSSGAKYLLTTTFTQRTENQDLGEGFWRTLNLQLAPFNFPPPLKLINEGCTEENHLYTDKCLGLWRFEDLVSI